VLVKDLENANQMAACLQPYTNHPYDRREERVAADEVVKIDTRESEPCNAWSRLIYWGRLALLGSVRLF